jgi:integrase
VPTQKGVDEAAEEDFAHFIYPADIPTPEVIAAVPKLAAARQRGRWWEELMVHLAAASGVRGGELLDLAAEDWDPPDRTLLVDSQSLSKSVARCSLREASQVAPNYRDGDWC